MNAKIIVEFEALPDERFGGVPATRRLAQLLKVAGRRLGLRCTGVRSQLELHGLTPAEVPPGAQRGYTSMRKRGPADGSRPPSGDGAGKVA